MTSSKLIFAPAFVRDVKTIFEYTKKNWGEIQAETYHTNIEKHLNRILQNPYVGRSRADISEKHRSLLVGVHVLIYFVQDANIHICRLLHHSQDFLKHEIPS